MGKVSFITPCPEVGLFRLWYHDWMVVKIPKTEQVVIYVLLVPFLAIIMLVAAWLLKECI
jgi:hypothetical protein